LLHLDGSFHRWFALAPETRPCLILVSDDATKRVLHAAFYPTESQLAVLTSLAAVLRTEGLPLALYTDRAGWAFYTPKAKGPVDKTRLTHVGRALARLGIEHIPSYSPQARGRSERLNRTVQDRLVNELRVAGITTAEAANHYLATHYVPQHNATFAVPPRDPASAFVPLGTADVEAILCVEVARVVARDNTVTVGRQILQLTAQPGRRSCAGLPVTVRQQLTGDLAVHHGTRVLGRFTADGHALDTLQTECVAPPALSPARRAPRRSTSPASLPQQMSL
jgi:hypothetical protein